MEVKLIAITKYLSGNGTPEELLEHAGRICYRSKSRGSPGAFLRARIRDGHESLIEHASATFEISGISRACSHQLVRHRLASYSQSSQRFCERGKWRSVEPQSISDNDSAATVFHHAMERAKVDYNTLRQCGISKQDARFVLPAATPTRIIATMNFRQLLHVFKLRISVHAQWEIRDVCIQMLELIYPIAPSVFGGLREELMTKSFYGDKRC